MELAALVAISEPKKVSISGPTLQRALVMDFPPSKSIHPAHINKWYINSYKTGVKNDSLICLDQMYSLVSKAAKTLFFRSYDFLFQLSLLK
jgi:hypothetical protein